MADDANKGLEQQLREQLEKEMADRRAARTKETAEGKASARDALEEELQREIEEKIKQAPKSSDSSAKPTSADNDMVTKLEDEIQRELEARLNGTVSSKADVSAKPDNPRKRPTVTEVKAIPIAKEPAVAPAVAKPEPTGVKVAQPETPSAVKVAQPETPSAVKVAQPETQTPAKVAQPETQTPAKVAQPETPAAPTPNVDNGSAAADGTAAGVSVKVVDPEEGGARPANAPAPGKTTRKRKPSTRGRSNPSRKTQRRPRKPGTLRTKNKTSNTRNLSDQEQKLLEEKAKIDAKFKKQQRYLYVAITGGTLIAAAILLPLAIQLRGCIQGGGGAPKTTVKPKHDKLPSRITGSHTSKQTRPKVELDPISSMDELQRKVGEELKRYKYQRAVDYLEKFMKDQPAYSSQCKSRIKEIAEDYVTNAVGTSRWQAEQPLIAQGMFSDDPGDIRKAISAMKRLGRGNRTERFAAEYYVRLMTQRHVELTGGILPY